MKLLKKLVVLVLLVLVTTGCVGNATSYRITFRTNGGNEIAQAEVVKGLETQNNSLKEQVIGLHALGNAVAEANTMIEPTTDYEEYVKKVA